MPSSVPRLSAFYNNPSRHERTGTPVDTINTMDAEPAPLKLELDKSRGLDVHWDDGTMMHYPLALLRRMSPSADAREIRQRLEDDPLAVIPPGPAPGALAATDAELVGNYAIRIHFNDGHSTGIFSWRYLRRLEGQIGDSS